MRKAVALVFFLLAVTPGLWGQGKGSEDHRAFRKRMNELVSEGNRQYDRGDRDKLAACIDALQESLLERSRKGLLDPTDSLEYYADLFKLKGDLEYENSFYDESAYQKAEDYFLRALNIYYLPDSPFSRDLDKVPMVYRELAQLYYKMGEYPMAVKNIYIAKSDYSDAYLNGEFEQGDPLWYEWLEIDAQAALCDARDGQVVTAERDIEWVIKQIPKGTAHYYEMLRKKAKIILLSKTKDKESRALPLYKEYFQWIRKETIQTLAGMTPEERNDHWMHLRPFVTDAFRLEGTDPGFVYDVALFSKGLLLQMNKLERQNQANSFLTSLQKGWTDIQKELPNDACALEYIQYEKDGEQRMGVVVVKKTGRPVWVPLMSPEDFFDYEIEGKTVEKRIYSTSSSYKNALYRCEPLKKELWPDKLLSVLGKTRIVYFSPDGYIHQMAVEYMLPKEWEGKELHRLSSTRVILEKRPIHTHAALLLGGLDYDNSTVSSSEGNDEHAYKYMRQQYLDGYGYGFLEGTEEEAMSIYQARNRKGDLLLMGDEANEETVRSVIGKYPVVSIATHGGFNSAAIPQGTDLKPSQVDYTLSENMIALSGAMASARDSRFIPSHLDGLLSAAEMASLDLSGVDVMVLSACQTGLGFVTSDGVFGIQRGLKNAGAGIMVLSLWSVDDSATKEIMVAFHSALAGGTDPYKAFMAARAQLIARGPEFYYETKYNRKKGYIEKIRKVKDYSDPRYVNPFIIIDAL